MTAAGPLAGLGVVLTRPRAQCEDIAAALEANGANVIVFPALDIVPVALSSDSLAALASLPSASLAIFVSANAAEHGIAAARRAGPWPGTVAVAGVGDATAARLRDAGFTNVISPATGFDSESLLACPALQDVAGRRVLIFRGIGGRERLRTELERRGAAVGYVESYRRERPASDPAGLLAALAAGRIDAVHAMSAETVDNFLALAGPGVSWSGVALVVPHPAIARHAASAPFGRALVSGPGIPSLIETLHELRKAP
ncbi:MAG TPA: uroporphyrinogen-III synthase [Usitatibacteraceae bacterium]|nr:uroporphyrinogen-III synthase [Usitatibacteraceae bacterium]